MTRRRLPTMTDPHPSEHLDSAEFPKSATLPPEGLARRELLELFGISMALAAGGCFRTPTEELVPYGDRPADITPGVPLHYATSFALGGYGTGLVVRSFQGHPTKIEGNTLHPASLGAASIFAQALTTQLYDPHRAKAYRHRNRPISKGAFIRAQVARANELEKNGGAGLRLLLEPTASPTVGYLVGRIAARYPKAKAFAYDPYERENLYEGAKLAFGRPVETLVDWSRARVIVALDDDFLGTGPYALRDAHEFVKTRTPDDGMSRLYVVESALTITGMFADNRLSLRSREIRDFALALVRKLGEKHLPELSNVGTLDAFATSSTKAIEVMARDLARAGDRGLVVVGPRQPPIVIALAHAINAALGSAKSLVSYVEPGLIEARSGAAGLSELVAEISSGEVSTLIIDAFDPAATAPSDIDLTSAMTKVDWVAYSGLREDRTAQYASYFAPAAHVLESWGDTRALDGTVGLVQPLIAPIYGGMSQLELFAPYAGLSDESGYSITKSFWRSKTQTDDFDDVWEDWLAEGIVPNTASSVASITIAWGALRKALRALEPMGDRGLDIEFLGSSKVHDGRFAMSAWLQELPDPMTKMSWDGSARMGPSLASRLGLASGDIVRLRYRDRLLETSIVVVPGHADGAVSLPMGYGLMAPDPEAEPVGADAFALRCSDAMWFDGGLELLPTGMRRALADQQRHYRMHGRDLAITANLESFREEGANFLSHLKGPVAKLYDPFPYTSEYQWGMAIDLNRCIGCAACVVACQAENNIPVVGKENARLGREMHWLRIDRYFEGAVESPRVVTQPVMCMHCEAAPCEYVCPVNATVHSDEGLNEMVYNRCVGTRYCSNNCPYKVRRFNYLDYHPRSEGVRAMMHNPQVTVRSRGVMEKCTYCVQRIERARIDARRQRLPIDIAELQTACQQTCPTEAIVFGSINEAGSKLAALRADIRRYDLLHDRGMRPRTIYLARIGNPSPEL